MSVMRYVRSRFATLKPPMDRVANPIKALRVVTKEQWLFFWCAWAGWVWDAFDFFTVGLTVTPLAKDFNKSNSEITWGITLVLMFRSVGSVIFGIWADRWGRKWPFIFTNVLFVILELGTGFCKTYPQFLACRALFGIAMGGLYGNAVATALEDVPDIARGALSGLFQAGYPMGYLLCTAFTRALVGTTPHGWRPLYWFGAVPPVFIIAFRLMLPETVRYRERQIAEEAGTHRPLGFLHEAKIAIQHHWLTLAYLILLLAGFNFMAHGAQDFYPTMLDNQFEFSPDDVTITQVAANLGAIAGGVTVGYLSDIFGRRLTIMASCIGGAATLYPYTHVSNLTVSAPAFFLQFFVQGAFGVIPSHLLELSPGAIRTFAVGTAYQLGNLASSPAATIQSSIGEKFYPLPSSTGVKRYDYAIVITAFLGACIAFVFFITLIGPEKKGQQLGIVTEDSPDENDSNVKEGSKNQTQPV
ncbi:major facilitator superfamily domain-containing protein [Aspergillus heterothallicus]